MNRQYSIFTVSLLENGQDFLYTQYLPHYEYGYEQAEERHINHFAQITVANPHLGGFRVKLINLKY